VITAGVVIALKDTHDAQGHTIMLRSTSLLRILIIMTVALAAWSQAHAQQPDNVYSTYGVHNPPADSPCANPDCVYVRGPNEPTDPRYPAYWSSNWTMYRVFNRYAEFSPPYDRAPPPPLKPVRDYEISYGATYYDSTWHGPQGDGAMMERYDGRCLPIFPISNHFSCAFISLGDTAFFLTYAKDRPKGMPPVCLFSPVNHPPKRDFVSHLPYSKGDSAQLHDRVQGYSFWVSGANGQPIQTGVRPDRTKDQAIMFGYAFNSRPTPDRMDKKAEPYRHPQSFYFSGYPLPPANAPIVSQNYTNFAMIRPDPKKTWDQVSSLDPKTLPACQLFNPPSAPQATAAAQRAPTWGDLKTKTK
jgi:hypothetical protein